ncbi:MAG TPA: hypothetical protein VG245_10420 [Candidatus Dormibacteraeota bacterium]|jgi:hypothetical protein|nr:hypothetical protein [Candidatus Dormibacteraeota bacterium]
MSRKLFVSRETVRVLDDAQIQAAAGGIDSRAGGICQYTVATLCPLTRANVCGVHTGAQDG